MSKGVFSGQQSIVATNYNCGCIEIAIATFYDVDVTVDGQEQDFIR